MFLNSSTPVITHRSRWQPSDLIRRSTLPPRLCPVTGGLKTLAKHCFTSFAGARVLSVVAFFGDFSEDVLMFKVASVVFNFAKTSALMIVATWQFVSAAHSEDIDLLLTSGRVYLSNEQSSPTFAEAIGIREGAIVFVGSDADSRTLKATTRIDLKGKLVMPGFIDAHVHAAVAGVDAKSCSIADATKLEDAKQIIRDCLAANPPKPGSWFQVVNFNLAGKTIPVAQWDSLRSDGPMVVFGSDGHTLYANTAAMAAAKVTAATQAPKGGSLDVSQGFFADAAMDMVTAAMPVKTPEESLAEMLQGALYGMRYLNALGVTGMREASASEPQIEAYAQLAKEGRLTVRSEQTVRIDPAGDPKSEIGKAAAIRAKFSGNPFVTINSLKVFADGVIEFPAQTAALMQPYLDAATGKPSEKKGDLLFDPARVGAMYAEAVAQNFDIHTHAIGDRAIHETLNAYAAIRNLAGGKQRKLSIAHLQLIDPIDFPRFAELDVSANFQLYWALPESYTIDALLPYIGEARHKLLYPAGSLLKAAAPLSGGSDWPVSTSNPLDAMRMAVTRISPTAPDGYIFDISGIADASAYIKSFSGKPFKVLNADERLPIKAFVDAYTLGSARELRMDGEVGTLAKGKRADFVILNQNLFDVAARNPEEIDDIRVCQTYFEGKLVYSHNAPDDPLGRPAALGCE